MYSTTYLKKIIIVIPTLLIFGIAGNLLFAQTSIRQVDPLIEKFLDPEKYPGMMIAAHRGIQCQREKSKFWGLLCVALPKHK